MSKLVSDLKNSVSGLLQGADLSNVTNLNGSIERAARTLIQKAGIPEAIGRTSITLYNGVDTYTAPTTIFGTGLIDARPSGQRRSMMDYVYKDFVADFDRTKSGVSNGYMVSFEFDKGTGLIRIVQSIATPKVTLDTMTSLTGWTASGSASTPVLDYSDYYQVNASMRYTLSGASSGYLSKTISSLNLTQYQGVGVIFLAIETPSSTNLTSLDIRLGSDSNNYYSLSVTSGFLGAWTSGKWTLIAFDLAQASTTGTPTITAMTYVRVGVTHAATLTNFRVGGMWISLPFPSELYYRSAAIFKHSTNDPLATITDDTDVIILNDSAYTLLEYEAAITIAMQSGGSLASGVVGGLNALLNGARARNGAVLSLGLYDLYRSENPSEILRATGSYID